MLCSTAAFLGVARLAGLRLVRFSNIPRSSGPFQYSIRDLLIWTTALAVVLSALRSLQIVWIPPWSWLDVIVIFGSFTLVAVVAMFSALGNQWLLARLFAPPLSVLVGPYLFVVGGTGSRSLDYFVLLLGLMAAWLIVTLCAVRLAGYRLVRKGRIAQRQDTDTAAPSEDNSPQESTAATEPLQGN